MKLQEVDEKLEKTIGSTHNILDGKIGKVSEELQSQIKKAEAERQMFSKKIDAHDSALNSLRTEIKDVTSRILAINDKVKDVQSLIETNTSKL